MAVLGSECPDLSPVLRRVREKTADYSRYNFSRTQNDLLKCFFDLSQEFNTLEDLYRICVAVPLEMLEVECALFLLDKSEQLLEEVCNSRDGLVNESRAVPTGIHLEDEPYTVNDMFILPLHRRPEAFMPAAIQAGGASVDTLQSHSRIMGILSIKPASRLSEDDRFFCKKYSNRVAYSLHNRLLARQNIDHLRFINSLVMDIEHNVIVPNMYFKYLFNQLRKKILELGAVEQEMRQLLGKEVITHGDCNGVIGVVNTVGGDLMGYYQEMQKHHANVSLFLESLFRREHFERGHLVLRPKRCLIERDIILPQLDQYRSRLQAGRIKVAKPVGMEEEEIPILVDLGLLSQVYANLFSNAVKYTEEIIDEHGNPRKAVAYGREILNDYFGPGRQGIKFNVFTTGVHLSPDDAARAFEEGKRGGNSSGKPGTGHGLSFIQHVIELHGGEVGYEATPQGNNFFFILPLLAGIS